MERSGHLPIMMSALWYLMETVQDLPPSKANLPERHPGPAQQEYDPRWGQLQEPNPKPLVSKGPVTYAVGPADSDSKENSS